MYLHSTISSSCLPFLLYILVVSMWTSGPETRPRPISLKRYGPKSTNFCKTCPIQSSPNAHFYVQEPGTGPGPEPEPEPKKFHQICSKVHQFL